MQKSKSSSNVGQFVTRKILRSRSKSQTRPPLTSSAAYSKWAPAEKFTWTSEFGDRLILSDVPLQNLSGVEAKFLQRVAIEKINELNIGINLNVGNNEKLQKRRVLPKKKAMTTSFFDIGKKDDQSSCFGVFGNSLECCVANDKKRAKYIPESVGGSRGSRSSIASLFRGSSDNVRSCESLPLTSNADSMVASTGKSASPNYFSNLTKSSSMQWDMRRKSQEFDAADDFKIPKSYDEELELQVPSFVNSCIRHLEDNGLQKVGLFRVSTSKKRLKQLREDFDKNSNKIIDPETCAHDVATLLKEFLRDLPEPLLCSSLYKAFLETQKIRNRRLQLEALSHLIKLLPAAHRDTLYVLLRFLARVAASSDDVTDSDGRVQINGNKMDSNNLATVFAPNILRTNLQRGNEAMSQRSGSTSAACEQELMNDAINVVRIMIDHYEELFRVPAELIDIAYSYMLDECPEQLYNHCEQRNLNARNEASASISPLSSPDQINADSLHSTDPAVTEAMISNRFYTRQAVMHNNDASRVNDDVTMNGSSRSSSKRLGRHEHRLTTELSKDRRQSSPNVLGKTNVVSGSLQITIPKEVNLGIGNKLSICNVDPNDLNEVFCQPDQSQLTNLGSLNEAPYNGSENADIRSQYIPISGSLSFSAKKEIPTIAKNNEGSRRDRTKLSRDSSGSSLSPPPTTLVGKPAADDAHRNTSSFKKSDSRKKLSNEPKLPASISNIGGAILRSKTADFERMSQASRPTQNSTSTTGRSASNSQATGRQLYKRQELISSSKRPSSSK